jgi:hypothetical protein
MTILNLVSIYSLLVNSFNPYYLFCSIQFQNQNIKKDCSNFGGFLNNQCLDYFNENNIIKNLSDCSQYINIRDDINLINDKWTPFINYIINYDKYYNTFSSINERFIIFHENLDYINKHNQNNNSSYFLGLTNFADMKYNEYSDFINKITNIKNNICINGKEESGNILEYVDWRENNAVTDVKDQGQCGSCWAFSTTGSLEGVYAIKNKNIKSFSEQQLVDCSLTYGNMGCNGGIMQNAYTYIHDKGITTEEAYPYTGVKESCRKYIPVTYISSCINVIPNELQLTYAVMKNPVSVSIEADSRSFQFYKSGVYDNADCGTNLDHGVLVVGYGNENGKDYWLVKNSWGINWGEAGYIKILRDSVKESTKGMCGIAMDTSYPEIF